MIRMPFGVCGGTTQDIGKLRHREGSFGLMKIYYY